MFIEPVWPAPKSVCSIITLRTGGCSEAPYASMNLAMHVADDAAKVQRNREELTADTSETFGAAPIFHWLNQVHGTRVVKLGASPVEQDADASYCQLSGQACVVLTADCLPVLICDSRGREVAAVHAGWRGLAAGVITAAVSQFSARPHSLMAYLGPAISQQAFEVGDDVRQSFLKEFARFGGRRNVESAFYARPEYPTKFSADLYELARLELKQLGVSAIYGGEFCTVKDNNKFYSYRKEVKTGRFASAIWINSNS